MERGKVASASAEGEVRDGVWKRDDVGGESSGWRRKEVVEKESGRVVVALGCLCVFVLFLVSNDGAGEWSWGIGSYSAEMIFNTMQ